MGGGDAQERGGVLFQAIMHVCEPRSGTQTKADSIHWAHERLGKQGLRQAEEVLHMFFCALAVSMLVCSRIMVDTRPFTPCLTHLMNCPSSSSLRPLSLPVP